ncbi:MAG: hypothetical protein HY898_27860 [Deltaproteobacteria bacterium]|nr:hypothetical protein [Deltaproteobacteria bacterium]
MDEESRRQLALWKLGVLGPLMSARLEHGDVRAYLCAAAARVHRMPDGRQVQLSERTIETWHYDYQRGGLEALMPRGWDRRVRLSTEGGLSENRHCARSRFAGIHPSSPQRTLSRVFDLARTHEDSRSRHHFFAGGGL